MLRIFQMPLVYNKELTKIAFSLKSEIQGGCDRKVASETSYINLYIF